MSLESFITKVFNITEEELKALIYEGEAGKELLKTDAGEVLINKYATDIAAKNKTNEQAKFDQGYQKANKEIAARYKAALKDKLKYESDKEDISEIFEEVAEQIRVKSKSTLTDDQVKSHQVFLAREKELKDAIEKEKEERENEKNNIISEYKKKENILKVKEKAESVLLASGAVLSEDPSRRKNQINVFLNQFEGFDYDLSGEVPLILKDGARLEDKFNHPVKFDDFIKNQAESLFDFKVQDNRGSGGNGGGSGGGSSFVFKDKDDYATQRANEPDRAKRVEMDTVFAASQK